MDEYDYYETWMEDCSYLILEGGQWAQLKYLEPVTFEHLDRDHVMPGFWCCWLWDATKPPSPNPMDDLVFHTGDSKGLAVDLMFWFNDDRKIYFSGSE